MYAEIVGAIGSAKTLMELLKAAHELSNYNEVVSAVSEVNTKLMAASAVALESQEKQATLAQRIRDLEKELMELKDWQREAECYQLTQVGPGVLAYRLKPGVKPGEPSHLLCANCFSNKEKGFLQRRYEGEEKDPYLCQRCGAIIDIPHSRRQPKVTDVVEDWEDY